MTMPDLAAPLVAALSSEASITSNLADGSASIFSRQPVPDGYDFPLIVVATQLQAGEEDGVSDQRPVIDRDIMVYGRNDVASFRTVESIAFALHALFHRNPGAITVTDWTVIDIIASGPSPAPVDDEQTVGRRVTLRMMMAKKN